MPNITNSKIITFSMVIVSVIIFLGASLEWYLLIYNNPSNVFDRMLHNSLATTGVSKSVSQKDSDQQVDQSTQLVTTPKQQVHSTAVLRQGADRATVITTESIGTPDADYVRYADIKTSEKTVEGKNFDFSTLIGTWGKADAKDPESGGAQLFNQTVLGVLPVGSLTANQRQELLKQIKTDQVYSINFANVKKGHTSGRPVYSYDVSVKPTAYVSMLKTFARDIGLKQFESVDPNQYADAAPLLFSFDIDVWSGELTGITYKDATKRTETYGSYGAQLKIDVPSKTIPVQELQARLQQIQ